ncbi:chromosomal replication initiator protein DnaA [Helicobacter enhydrae]|uniref:Chromosomal replication initiator protein DnaA n=1 Tax=Helicobacter enhydrae TaxID=222136 RepID=A0A1B1U5Z3_9HELI|nr:chromosomal replication initiator protein DnaA [Helicobacter enhydrae]ANV98176.1 chromosomal replication initiator protein DnaA [Helicobacter enhydrae]
MDNILERFKEEITNYEYKTYISKMKYDADDSKANHIIFNVPNIFLANWIKATYQERLQSFFEQHIHHKFKIEIRVQKKITKLSNQTQKIQKKIITKTLLNPAYIFDLFIVGDSNKLAFEVARIVAQTQAKQYNPMLIHGNTGVGKTHLLNAIGNEATKNGKVVIYVTAEQFLNDYLTRINNNTMDRFREKYRNCDYLLIDDVQFFGGKEKIQEEFFHTFNELHNNQKQIVMTSDKSPEKINGLEERLKSRFGWGFCTNIFPPEIETKILIIRQKCNTNNYKIDDEIIQLIASNTNDTRQIEGILLKLNTQSLILGQEITTKMANNVIKETFERSNEDITLEKIIKTTALTLNIKPSDIKSKSRTKVVANARRYVIYLARSLTLNSMPVLAKELNMKDHSAISKAYKKIEEEINTNLMTKATIEEIKMKILEEDKK